MSVTHPSGGCVPSRSLTDTMVSLRRLRTAVQASGRQFVLIVAPDKTTMVPAAARRLSGEALRCAARG